MEATKSAIEPGGDGLTEGVAVPSPAGPADDRDLGLPAPPKVGLSRPIQTLRISIRQIQFVFAASRRLGDVFELETLIERDGQLVMTSHPEHIKSLFTAKPELAPSLTGESPLRPIVGPNSVLTALGARHMRQRKLLLPHFHGEAVQRYVQMIEEVADREIDRWPLEETFALAPRMQAITLDVIMAGIFGVEGVPAPGTPERRLRTVIRTLVAMSTRPEAQLMELRNVGRDEPVGLLKLLLSILDRSVYAVIEARRNAPRGHDILSLLLDAETEEGERLSDQELRDELITLVLAGHETTANSLAWAFERLLRNPHSYDRLRETVRAGGEEGNAYVEATIHEAMRSRPVIPIVGRRVKVPWRLGDYAVPENTSVLMSILLLHHRHDIYPDPFSFRPERFLGHKPGTYTWIPFGGGIRRCLGATLAMAEQRVVLDAIARRTDMRAPDPQPERARHRNVTMIPQHGARVQITRHL